MTDKIKPFLLEKLRECETIIGKRRTKNKRIKIIYILLIVSAIVGNSSVLILSSFTIPPIAISCISGFTAIATALGIKFNLQDRKEKLTKDIQKLNKIKDKLDFIVSCNGNLTEEQCDTILEQFRVL